MGAVRKVLNLDPERPEPGVASRTTGDTAVCRLLLVSDIRFLGEGLAEIFARDKDFTIVGVAPGIDKAMAITAADEPHVTLIDAALPGGLAAARALDELAPQTPIVALGLAETEADVIAWAEAGISGYIPRTAGLADLVGFLHDIVHGEQICSTRVAAGLLRWISSTARAGSAQNPRAKPPALTVREEQVVRLICTGLSNKEISRHLNIGLATTKSHVHNLLGKLEFERRGQVARWSRDHAWMLRDEP